MILYDDSVPQFGTNISKCGNFLVLVLQCGIL